MNKYSKKPQTTYCERCGEELSEHKKKYGATYCGSFCQRTAWAERRDTIKK